MKISEIMYNPSTEGSPHTELPFHGRNYLGNRVIRYFDLYEFAAYLEEHDNIPEDIRDASGEVASYIIYPPPPQGTGISMNHCFGLGVPNGEGGLSIYIYDYQEGYYSFDGLYKNTDLPQSTAWDEFIGELVEYMGGN